MKFRRWNHFRAWFGGYFWVPCPTCNQYFGGHEWKGDPRFNAIPTDREGMREGICPDCSQRWESTGVQPRSLTITL